MNVCPNIRKAARFMQRTKEKEFILSFMAYNAQVPMKEKVCFFSDFKFPNRPPVRRWHD